ncbi:MAG TPA: SDR family NAD(P)-dependent oxidoreductase [Acidimicrobiales bacterium]|jgi:NAD(P)-dependent dehydrogenase (short-subunit alcohol dehydrogenase family)
MIVTGASSGIGRAVGTELASRGANVWLIGRNAERLRAAREAAHDAGGGGQVYTAEVDVVNADAVSAFVEQVSSTHSELHALIHNAGALFRDYGVFDDGSGTLTERSLATHVLAPFRLSLLLAPLLWRADQSVITTVTSGGMYTQRFDPDHIEARSEGYRGAVAYARAKRAQVVLAHEWARRWNAQGVASYAVHPGWVNTPGLASGLPSFAKLGPLLRTPSQGADTVVWLAADEPRRTLASAPMEGLWLDRHERGEYYLPMTRRSRPESERDGRALWAWCAERAGLGY